MRILADSNIVAEAVRAMRAAGHDVVYVAERPADPGDAALLAEAVAEGWAFLTKDHDIGALVHHDSLPHCGVLIVDDLGDAVAETKPILATLCSHHAQLNTSASLRASAVGIREVLGRGRPPHLNFDPARVRA